MTQTEVLAFDLGAGSGRAMIGMLKVEDGRKLLELEEIHRFPNEQIRLGNHLHWDILGLFTQLKTGLKRAFQGGHQPRSFGIDTWGVDFGLLDRNGELIGIPYSYRDSQTEGLIGELNRLIGAEALYAQSGLQFMPFNTVYQLVAMRKASSPKLDAAETLLFMPDLLTYMLTGVISCEFTIASTSGLLHPVTREWNHALMDQLRIPERLFVDPMQPGTWVGTLRPDICEELGIPAIQAVAVGTHDTESAVVAVPASDGPFCYLVSGTWSLFGTELDEAIVSREALEQNFSNEGGVGGKYQLLKNIMGMWLLEECRREWKQAGEEASYEQLIAEARDVRPFRSLIDPEDLRFYSPGEMAEKIRSFCRETGQPEPGSRGELVRCILESLALKYRDVFEQTERLTGQQFAALHMVGGGIRNTLLCQFTANALGKQVLAGPVEASALGNALVQLMHLGEVADLQEARRIVRDSFEVAVYEPQDIEMWQAEFVRYKGLRGAEGSV